MLNNSLLSRQNGNLYKDRLETKEDSLIREFEMDSSSKILLIEADPDVQYVRSRLLVKDRHDVTIATCFPDAVKAVKENIFDLVIMCVDNPEVLNMLLAQFPPNTAVLLLADHNIAGYLAENINYGIRSYLFKPFSNTRFRKSVKRAIINSITLKESMRNEILTSLGAANHKLAVESRIDKILETIAQIAMDGTNADYVTIRLNTGSRIPLTKIETGKIIPSWDKVISRLDVITEPVVLCEEISSDSEMIEAMHKTGISSIIRVPLSNKGKIIGSITEVKTRANGKFSQSDLCLISILAWWSVMAIDNTNSYLDYMKEYLHADKLLDHISFAQENERKRVAVEIHDGVAQWLVGASYDIKLCSRLISDSNYSELGNTLENVRGVLQKSVKELRRAISDLPLPSLEEFGLNGIIMKLAEKLAVEGIKCRVNISDTLPALTTAQQKTFYWLIQESITNIKKHSAATCVDISLMQTGDSLNLCITDNGVGFSVGKAMESGLSLEHIGLLGMQERADFLNGCLKIESEPGKGTTIKCSFSLLPPEVVMIART